MAYTPNVPSATIEFSIVGNWEKEMRKMRLLAPDVFASALWGQEKAAKRLKKIVKGHLQNQDLTDWQTLSPKTLRRKSDWRTLVESEMYLISITAWRKKYVYYVGVPRGITEPNGIETARVAAIHEFKSMASKGAPRRPLWQPSIEEMGGARGIRKIVMTVIYKKLIARGWAVTFFKG